LWWFAKGTINHCRGIVRQGINVLSPTADLSEKNQFDFSAGNVNSDATIKHSHLLYSTYPMEIISPVPAFSEQSLQEVMDVVEIIQRSFRVEVNESCSLHVHLGNEEYGFEVSTIRQLLALLWTLEPHVNTLHPTDHHENRYCSGMRVNSPLAKRTVDEGLTPAEGLE
jgi:hypothetical protein